jgi:hypothetical protein
VPPVAAEFAVWGAALVYRLSGFGLVISGLGLLRRALAAGIRCRPPFKALPENAAWAKAL